jgi:hypothetical protein
MIFTAREIQALFMPAGIKVLRVFCFLLSMMTYIQWFFYRNEVPPLLPDKRGARVWRENGMRAGSS